MKNDIQSIYEQYMKIITEANEEPRYNNDMKKAIYWKHGEEKMSVNELNAELAKINASIALEEKKQSGKEQTELKFPSILPLLLKARQGLMKLRAEKIGK
jgi:hypothetical protein